MPSMSPTADDPSVAPTESPTTECSIFSDERSCRLSQCGWNRHDLTCVHSCSRVSDFVVIGDKIGGNPSATDVDDCEQACIDTAKCTRFSFGNAQCSLYARYTDLVADHGTISGFCLGTHSPTEIPTTSPTT